MDIPLEKIELIKLIANTNDKDVLRSVKEVFTVQKEDFWDELTLEQQQSTELSLEQYREGKYSDFNVFIENHL